MTDEEFEVSLTADLARLAALATVRPDLSDVYARLRAVARAARRNHAGPPRALRRWAVAAAVVAATSAVAIIGFDTSDESGSAFAGWSPEPLTATPQNLADVIEACEMPPISVGPPGALDMRGGGGIAAWEVGMVCVFDTRRGELTALANDTMCCWNDHPTITEAVAHRDEQPVLVLRASVAGATEEPMVGFVVGVASSEVDTLLVQLANGLAIEAAVQENGLFTVWWPDGEMDQFETARLVATDAQGLVLTDDLVMNVHKQGIPVVPSNESPSPIDSTPADSAPADNAPATDAP